MNTAKLIRKLDGSWSGDARLFELSQPIEYDKPWNETEPPAKKTCFVIVSATIAPFSGSETYIFPATKEGEVISWGELDGSYRGGLSHEEALMGAGYKVQ